ncbi:transposase, partial [Acidimangrovimonas sediminis]|uniref:transposase n=1 Tax=Acidimangrovimonas sediminis TaxID=2056283 RepID=UPI001E56E382
MPWHYIDPGQSSGKQPPGLFSDPPHTQQNAFIESFNGSLRDELFFCNRGVAVKRSITLVPSGVMLLSAVGMALPH